MKKSFLSTAIAAVMALSGSAHAIELTFKFDVLSSGPEIYACNAGLVHWNPGGQICYIDGTQQSCDPGACAPGDDSCVNNCKCTSAANSHRGDFMVATHGPANGATANSSSVQAGEWSFNTIFTEQGSWGSRIDSLTFNLGSERYGAQYFVDICYQGSQIEYFQNNIQAPHTLLAQATITDISAGSGLSYSDLANLATAAIWSCDRQGVGNYQFAHDGNNVYDTFANEVWGEGQTWSSTHAASSNTIEYFNNVLINGGSDAPRFCKVRYMFGEFAYSNLRKWQLHGAKVCTHTKIESVAAENSNGGNPGYGSPSGGSLPGCGGGQEGGECPRSSNN